LEVGGFLFEIAIWGTVTWPATIGGKAFCEKYRLGWPSASKETETLSSDGVAVRSLGVLVVNVARYWI
jgi:hypothetical protein